MSTFGRWFDPLCHSWSLQAKKATLLYYIFFIYEISVPFLPTLTVFKTTIVWWTRRPQLLLLFTSPKRSLAISILFFCFFFSVWIHGNMSPVFGEGQDNGGTHSSGGIFKWKLLIERIKQGGSRIVYLKWGGILPIPQGRKIFSLPISISRVSAHPLLLCSYVRQKHSPSFELNSFSLSEALLSPLSLSCSNRGKEFTMGPWFRTFSV